MKTRPALLLSLIAAEIMLPWFTRGQGRLNFSNLAEGVNAPIYDIDGVTPFVGPVYRAQLWYLDDMEMFIPLETSETGFATGYNAGYFFGGTVVIPNIAGGETLTYQVRIWDSTTGTSWDTACLRTTSDIYDLELTEPPEDPANMVGFESFFPLIIPNPNCIPEVSPLLLAMLGTGLMFIRVRR